MMRKWTLEVMADFADKEKYDLIDREMRRLAVHAQATVLLINDNGQQPQLVLFSDDFFMGRTEINIMLRDKGDEIAKAIEDHGSEETEVSDELMQAMRNR